MIPINVRSVIDERKETFLSFREVDDLFIKELTDYLVKTNSIVDSLAFSEGSITGEGIQYLLTNYGSKLATLNMPTNCLGDEDIEELEFPPNLKSLGLGNNYLSEHMIAALQQFNINLGIEKQNQFSSSEYGSKAEPHFLAHYKRLQQVSGSAESKFNTLHSKVVDFLSFLSTLDQPDQEYVVQDLMKNMETKNIRIKLN